MNNFRLYTGDLVKLFCELIYNSKGDFNAWLNMYIFIVKYKHFGEFKEYVENLINEGEIKEND